MDGTLVEVGSFSACVAGAYIYLLCRIVVLL